MGSDVSAERYDRVVERRRAVALARHYRDVEGLSIAQIARQLGRSPAMIKTYFYDPTGEKTRAVKPRYLGVYRGCGAYTQPRNGKGDAYPYCKTCHPGAIAVRWTREQILAAMWMWRDHYGRLPSSYDWSRTHAHRRGGEPLRRLSQASGWRRLWSPPDSDLGRQLGRRCLGSRGSTVGDLHEGVRRLGGR